METAVNKRYMDVASGESIYFDGIRTGWDRFCGKCLDYWDLFTIWLRRNEPTTPFEEFVAEENKRRGIDAL